MLRCGSALRLTAASLVRTSKRLVSSQKPHVLVTRRIPQEYITELASRFQVALIDSDTAASRTDLLRLVPGKDGVLCTLTDKIDAELLNAAGPQLRVVSTISVGYDHIDVAECKRRNIQLGNTPGVLTDTTADTAVLLMLMVGRRALEGVQAVREGRWPAWQPFWLTGTDLTGATVGIVGMGSIGRATARRVRLGFGCRVLYTRSDRPGRPALPAEEGEHVPLDELLARSDFVSVHCPLTPATTRLCDAAFFQKMKRSAVFVNTSRGPVVDQDALVTALRSGTIAGAGLDVTTPEPLPPTHALLSLPNCTVLPHIGSATIATRHRMIRLAVDNLVAGLEGRPMQAPIA